jgi:hypothetical protein
MTSFAMLAFSLLPIGLMLVAMVFLRRAVRTPQTLLLQCSAILWLLVAVAARIASNPVIGLQLIPGHTQVFAKWSSPQEAKEYMDAYFKVAMALNFIENALFILLAVALVTFYRDQLGGPDKYLRSIGGAKSE